MGLRADMALWEGTFKNLEDVYTSDRIAAEALKAGADPIKFQMILNASQDPKPISGALRSSIAVGSLKTSGMRKSIDIGVHSSSAAFYAAWVEFGHGGPRPAPPHAYVLPAYDERRDEAEEAIANVLRNAQLK